MAKSPYSPRLLPFAPRADSPKTGYTAHAHLPRSGEHEIDFEYLTEAEARVSTSPVIYNPILETWMRITLTHASGEKSFAGAHPSLLPQAGLRVLRFPG